MASRARPRQSSTALALSGGSSSATGQALAPVGLLLAMVLLDRDEAVLLALRGHHLLEDAGQFAFRFLRHLGVLVERIGEHAHAHSEQDSDDLSRALAADAQAPLADVY